MGSWSSENATKAYIRTLKLERNEKEPDSAEFISAVAAGNNAQKMVIICAENSVINNVSALVSAAHQTGGYVTCILPSNKELQSAKHELKSDAKFVDFIVGNASVVLVNEYYRDADFLLIDCNINDYEHIMRQIQSTRDVKKGGVVVGFNAFCKGSSWQWSGLRTHLLPIGNGLMVTRINPSLSKDNSNLKGGIKTSNWVVKVDQCTGEEHVFRVRTSQRKLQVVV
ncbi:hypothetical protein RND81_14G125100 [Saponaria officinalis]|uniref:S-adenosyl-L-methionine-dependent methyltransferase n=1 Tax=Saponaria officinalis TaxID=3572 RepID=A0AAW1GPR6_SAPOF